MNIAEWRKRIDELDRQLVDLLNERARAASEIGALKRDTQMPVYEPEREREIFENVRHRNTGPLPDRDLVGVYERIIDVMRKIQRDQIGPKPDKPASAGENELEAEVNE